MGAVGALAPTVFLPRPEIIHISVPLFLPRPEVVLILAPTLFTPVRRQCLYYYINHHRNEKYMNIEEKEKTMVSNSKPKIYMNPKCI